MNGNKKTTLGVQSDILKQYADLCSTHACTECPIAERIGDGELTCQEMLKAFPEKVIAILAEVKDEPNTYIKEFRTRFQFNKAPVEDIANMICRKGVFEGIFLTADVCAKDCLECWKEEIINDVEDDRLYEEALKQNGLVTDTTGTYEEYDASHIGGAENE